MDRSSETEVIGLAAISSGSTVEVIDPGVRATGLTIGDGGFAGLAETGEGGKSEQRYENKLLHTGSLLGCS
jgi:hypothetical protein